MGYETATFIIPACAVNAPHRRDRIWIIAHASDRANRADRGQVREKDSLQEINRKEVGSGEFGGTDGHAADTNRWIKPQRWNSPGVGGIWKQNPWDGTSWIEAATRLCRVDDGVSPQLDKSRLKGLGNAIVPQVVVPIFQAIKPLISQCTGQRYACQ